jgi:hypothetical protein
MRRHVACSGFPRCIRTLAAGKRRAGAPRVRRSRGVEHRDRHAASCAAGRQAGCRVERRAVAVRWSLITVDQILTTHQESPEHSEPTHVTVLRWLKAVAPSLAELYESARSIIDDPSLPARVRILCHCMREITNRLPDRVSRVVVKGHTEYPALTRAIEARWQSVVPAGALIVGSVAPEPAHVQISFSAYVAIEALLADHRAADKRPIERLQNMFAAYVSSESLPALQPTIKKFKDVQDWFVAHVHADNRVDAEMASWQETLDNVAFVENTLFTIAAQWHRGQARTDDLLDEANRTAD